MSSEETQAGDLTDELAKKYDPERLLRLIAKRAGKGEALDLHLRQKYERRLGVDLSHVRIYTGEFAEEFNRQRSAYAVTIGSTGAILMGGSAEKSLASATGQALLGHELTHVAQQVRHGGGGLRRKTSFDGGMPFAEEHEMEAEAMERAILQEAAGGPPIVADDPNQAAAMQKARANAAAQLKDQIEKVKQRVIELMGEMTRSQTIRTGTVRRAEHHAARLAAILVEMSDSSADAGVVQSRVQLERLVAEDELVGRTIAGFSAPSVGLRAVDLDGVTLERLDLRGCDGDESRLERAELRQSDLRTSQWRGALWHRVRARDCDLTELDLTGAQLLRCELGPVRMARLRLHRARIQDCTFKDSELYCADFAGAVLLKVVFDGYEHATVSLSRTDWTGAALFDVDFKRANLYGANLTGAVLVRCDLRGVNLCSATLTGTRLVGCETSGIDLDGATL